jgi:hypothetical protein
LAVVREACAVRRAADVPAGTQPPRVRRLPGFILDIDVDDTGSAQVAALRPALRGGAGSCRYRPSGGQHYCRRDACILDRWTAARIRPALILRSE